MSSLLNEIQNGLVDNYFKAKVKDNGKVHLGMVVVMRWYIIGGKTAFIDINYQQYR